MSQFTLTPRAKTDLEEIWEYSAVQFGFEKAEAYIRDIQRAIESVASDPRRGRACDEVRAVYFRFPAGSHTLFFRLADNGFDIVRVLHARMDFGQQ